MITRIGHSAIKVKNLEESVKFYSDILEFKEAFRIYGDDGAASIVYLYITEGQFIEIFPNGQGEYVYDPKAVGHTHMCFEVSDAKASIEKIRAKGVAIDTELKTGKSKALQFWIHDPDGNRIELMQLPPESLQALASKKFME